MNHGSMTAALAALGLAGCLGAPREPERIPMAHGILGAYETRQDGVDEVWIDGELVGYSEALRVIDLQGKAYVRREVLDEHGQAIGFMDDQGRVYRYSIFGEPEHLTTGGHARAVSALFDRRGGEVRFQSAAAKTDAR
ncbi:MAG: hypothetical protein IPN34_25105 [Planctomycetes bacterium]|nr:hypothetical protein [Planctomycetota bacterium]